MEAAAQGKGDAAASFILSRRLLGSAPTGFRNPQSNSSLREVSEITPSNPES